MTLSHPISMSTNFSSSKTVSRSAQRLNTYYDQIQIENNLAGIGAPDVRPYARVSILGRIVSGLMDTGASISCIGGHLAADILKEEIYFQPITSNVQTADGKSQEILGKLHTSIEYNGDTKPCTFFIVPSLKQSLYLGIDFWTKFQLLPQGLGTDCENDHLATIDHNVFCALSENQQKTLEDTVKKFPSFTDKGLGRTTLLFHSIDVGDAVPIKQRHYPVSPAIEQMMFEELDRMLALGVIEESDSSWSSPVVLVRKPGKVRLCLDSRKVNNITRKDAYPMPIIHGLLSRLPKAEFITSLDLKDAYWQIPLDPSSRDKTAFSVPGRPLYQFTVMPFGLTNAPSTMTKLMDRTIPACLKHEVFVYLDDLLIVSDTFERHMEVLKTIAICLENAGLTINVQKSKFCMREVGYLGHIIGNGTIAMDPDKISAIMEYPPPRSVKQLRRFLGMTGWYQKFIKNYASLATPLTDALKGKQKFLWSEVANEAFNELKQAMITAPVLHTPDFSRSFYIHCDASHTGVGGVLMQLTDSGEEVPISYMSKKLNPCQRNYSVTEKECLAAILCIKKFRAYVEGQSFTVITDHASLKWLMSQSDLSSRLARWALKLQGYDFQIQHRKGQQNIVPDALSRVFTDDLSALDHGPGVDLQSPQFNSQEYQSLKDEVKRSLSTSSEIKVIDGFIFRRAEHASKEQVADDTVWKLWIPTELVPVVLQWAHTDNIAAHGGINKTLERIRRYYFWPNLVADVRSYVNQCEICKSTKHPNQTLRPPLSKTIESHRFFQKLYVDYLGPYPRSKTGNVGIFIVLDHFTKFPFLKAVKKFSVDAILPYIEEELFHCFGVPETVVSDNGVQFKSNAFNNLLQKYGVNHAYTASYAPQGNASERVNRSVLAAIKAYISPDQDNWDANLSQISCALRSSHHTAVNNTPYRLVFGQHMLTNGSQYELLRRLNCLEDRSISFNREDSTNIMRDQATRCMQKQHTRNERIYNLRSREITFVEGQEIFRRNFQQSNFAKGFCAKLAPSFIKARIRKKLGSAYYEIEDMQGKFVGKYHAKDLKQ